MTIQQIDRQKIEGLLRAYGSDTLSYFHLQEERQYFLSPTGNACLSYKLFNNVAIVAGDPLGPEDEIPLLLETFLDYISSWKLLPFFIGLSKTYMEIIKNKNMKMSKIGEEAILDLSVFDLRMLKKKVKRAVRHVTDMDVDVFFFNAGNLPENIRKQIEEISRDWIMRKGGKEKGFSMTLKRLPGSKDKDCEFAIAIQGERVLGYLCFVPSYASKSLSLDHMRSRSETPNGLYEFLIVKSAEYFKSSHIQKISLNFATFSNVVESSTSKLHIRKKLTDLIMKLYKCDSLRSFNNKFHPQWENRYVAYSSLRYLPQYIQAVMIAER